MNARRAYRTFRIVYAVLALQFAIPAVFFARRARRALDELPPLDGPWWVRAVLLYPARIERALAVVRARGLVPSTPNLLAAHHDGVDTSFFAYLAWCAAQPPDPAAALAALRRGELRFAAPAQTQA